MGSSDSSRTRRSTPTERTGSSTSRPTGRAHTRSGSSSTNGASASTEPPSAAIAPAPAGSCASRSTGAAAPETRAGSSSRTGRRSRSSSAAAACPRPTRAPGPARAAAAPPSGPASGDDDRVGRLAGARPDEPPARRQVDGERALAEEHAAGDAERRVLLLLQQETDRRAPVVDRDRVPARLEVRHALAPIGEGQPSGRADGSGEPAAERQDRGADDVLGR